MGKWQPALEAIYGNTSEGPVYIRELLSPMRPVYPDGMAERELINSFSQVLIISTKKCLEKSQFCEFSYRESTTMPLKKTLQL